MATKSIIDIDINDEKFNSFLTKFNAYKTAAAKSPPAWAATDKYTQAIAESMQAVVAAIAAQTVELGRVDKQQRSVATWSQTVGRAWTDISRSTKSAFGHITGITGQLLKWGALTSVFSGLLGFGSLFGLNRLSAGVSGGRRSALGLGIGYGEQKAFSTNFSRLVNPEGFLSGVADARGDITKRAGFYGAGLTERDLQGSTGEIGVKVLQGLKRIADQTDPKLYAQVIAARGLGQFATADDLRRLHGTSSDEFSKLIAAYGRDNGGFSLTNDTQRKWQEFTTQLTRAGEGIENTFVKGLTPLVPALTSLSEGVQKTVKAFLESDTLKKWLDQAGQGLEKFSKYIGTPEFEKNIQDFVAGIGKMAAAIGKVIDWFNGKYSPVKESDWNLNPLTGQKPRNAGDAKLNGWANYLLGRRIGLTTKPFSPSNIGNVSTQNGVAGDRPFNNPGNLRPPGRRTGFMQYATEEQGLMAMARQLQRYGSRGNDTIRGIISKYAPSSENNTQAYIDAVGKKTGFGPDQKLDMSDSTTLSKLMAAMTKQENSKTNYTPEGIKVIIENNTGGNSIASINQMRGAN